VKVLAFFLFALTYVCMHSVKGVDILNGQ